ncbi:MAG: RNA polymerase sigma factor [Dichotomicrobium sp.]
MEETNWLIAREIPRLRRYALTMVDDPVAADDLVQDTLERAIRKRHLWRRRGNIRSWLYRILYNLFLDRCAASARRNGEIGLDDAPVLQVFPDQEQQAHCRDVAQAMQQLPSDQRAAIALTALEGLSYDEAAEVLDVPIGTLRSRLSRGREALRSLFSGQDLGEDGSADYNVGAAASSRATLRRVK